MKIHQHIWSGTIDEVPKMIVIDDIMQSIDIRLTPINTLRYGLKLCTQGGDMITACSTCMSRRITDVISYMDLHIHSRGNNAVIQGNVYIICDGTIGHTAITEYTLVLYVNI